MAKKKEIVEQNTRNIRRKTRKQYSSEEKIRIVLEGFRGESTLAELCRITAAALMLQEGIHPKAVQEIMGHASISTTLGIYGHVTPGMREQAANVMDDLLAPIPVELKRS